MFHASTFVRTSLCALAIAVCAFTVAQSAETGSVNYSLSRIDALYDSYFVWLADMYDPETGGFWYAASSKEHPDRFAPDIESTAQAFSIMRRTGLLETMPPEMKDGLIRFFRARQEPNGFFFDAHTDMRNVKRLRDRALSYSRGVLRTLGADPVYEYPGAEHAADSEYLAYLSSPDAFRAWLDERPWDYAWMGVDHIWSQMSVLNNLPPERKDPLIKLMFDYLESRQDPDTGLWGGGEPYVRISGAFKGTMIYRSLKRPVPLADKIYTSTLRCMRTETAEDFCWVRNPVDMMAMMKNGGIVTVPDSDLEEFVRISVDNMAMFVRPDGGFSRERTHSLAAPNEVDLGMGEVEGDMNAGTQAITIRDGIYRLLGRKAPSLEKTADFYDRLRDTGKIH